MKRSELKKFDVFRYVVNGKPWGLTFYVEEAHKDAPYADGGRSFPSEASDFCSRASEVELLWRAAESNKPATLRKDLKPGTVFVYLNKDGADQGHAMYVDLALGGAPHAPWGKSVPDGHAMETPVRVIWEPPVETKEEYDTRTGTTRHTYSGLAEVAEAQAELGAPVSPHYTTTAVEPIDAIEAWGLGFRLANVVKYVARAGKKEGEEPVSDLRKALSYLKREIAALEGRRSWECD